MISSYVYPKIKIIIILKSRKVSIIQPIRVSFTIYIYPQPIRSREICTKSIRKLSFVGTRVSNASGFYLRSIASATELRLETLIPAGFRVGTQQGYPKERIKQTIKSVHIGYTDPTNWIKGIQQHFQENSKDLSIFGWTYQTVE